MGTMFWLGMAFALAAASFVEEKAVIVGLRQRLLEQLESVGGVRLNGSATQRIPHTLSLTFGEGEFNAAALSAGMAFSATSACNSASAAASHVLLALGLNQAQALSSLRVSLGRYSTQADVDRAIAVINDALQAPAPFW